MYLKVIVGGVATVFGGLYLGAGSGQDDYSRDIQKPLTAVYASLSDLESSDLAGLNADYRTAPQLQLKPEGPDALTWQLIRGNEAAMEVNVSFEPIGNGASTRVRANLVAQKLEDPAHALPPGQSEAVMKRAFANAFDTKLDGLERHGDKLDRDLE